MEMIARFKPGDNVPGFAASAVLAGRFVKISANKTAQGDYSITHCGAGERAFGVAERDSGPTTDDVNAWTRRVNVVRRGAIARVTAGGTISAGAEVESDANGKAVVLDAGVPLGVACNNVTNGNVVEVDLY